MAHALCRAAFATQSGAHCQGRFHKAPFCQKPAIGDSIMAIIKAGEKLDHLAAPPAFEGSQPCLRISRVIGVGNAPHIVEGSPLALGPAHSLPLKEIIRLQLAILVARGAIEIDGLLADQGNKRASQELALMFGQEELDLPGRLQKFPGAPIVGVRMTGKSIALTSDFQRSYQARTSSRFCAERIVMPFRSARRIL